MIARWLWFDHIPAGLALTAKERAKVLELARARRRGPALSRPDIWTRLMFVVGLTAVTLAFGTWLVFFVRMPLSVSSMVVSNVGGILVFNILLWVCIAWFVHRTNVAYVRWALWEIGRPVCLKCGYILTGQRSPTEPCPECGTRHQPHEVKK